MTGIGPEALVAFRASQMSNVAHAETIRFAICDVAEQAGF